MKTCTRREFSKLSLTAATAAAIFGFGARRASALAPLDPDASKINGVQIGLNVPYSFANPKMTNEGIWTNCVLLAIGAVELRTQPVEIFLGAPEDLVFPKKGISPSESKANGEKMAKWRKSVSIDRARDLRKKYENAGVLIQIVKVDGIFNMSDAELDYVFALAKTLGGRAISTEISRKEDDLKRIGSFADKHQMMVGYHGHAETKPEDWEKGFALAKFNGANVDLGHFVAGNNTSPVPFIKEHHERITHVHVKDRKMHNGPNTPFGEGDTPIKEVLQLIRDNKWPIQATIEFEYKIPEGSDRLKEIDRAVHYCKNALY